jgi:amino acid transporter
MRQNIYLNKMFNFIVKDYPGFILYLVSILMIFTMPYAWANGYETIFKCLVYFVFLLLVSIYFWILYKTKNFNKYVIDLKNLILLLVETTLVFAAIYLWFVFFDPKGQIVGFSDYYDVFKSHDKNTFLGKSYFISCVYCIIDSFHFSVVTAATVGYGDMYPKSHAAKLFVDFQIAYTFMIVVIGIGKYSARTTEPSILEKPDKTVCPEPR